MPAAQAVMRPTTAEILARLEDWEKPDDDDPPLAPCGCPLWEGPDTWHTFGCAWGRRGPVLRVVAVREVKPS